MVRGNVGGVEVGVVVGGEEGAAVLVRPHAGRGDGLGGVTARRLHQQAQLRSSMLCGESGKMGTQVLPEPGKPTSPVLSPGPASSV